MDSKWDRLIDHAVITLNMMRNSRVNNELSAYTCLNGAYVFNKCPLALSGTKVVAHTRQKIRGSFGYHGQNAYYVGLALEPY